MSNQYHEAGQNIKQKHNLYLILMCFGYLLIIPENKEKCPIDLIDPPIFNILMIAILFGSLENANILQRVLFHKSEI